jgi:hypothetical protein
LNSASAVLARGSDVPSWLYLVATYIYQGEELGLFEVADLKHADLQDPTWKRNVVLKKQRVFFQAQQ